MNSQEIAKTKQKQTKTTTPKDTKNHAKPKPQNPKTPWIWNRSYSFKLIPQSKLKNCSLAYESSFTKLK